MRKNPLKDRLREGKPILGPIMGFNSPALTELFAYAGFDFIIFDAEHGALSEESCENLVRTAEAANFPNIIRCPQNVPQSVLRYLDTGTLGVHIPQINTRQDAEMAVRAVKFHPMGARGLAGTRAHGYGALGPLSEQVKVANEETMLIAHIENIQAVHNLDDLLSVDGIDVWFIGTSDLSHSMAIPAQYNHPDLVETLNKTIERIGAAGKVAGSIARNADETKSLIDRGCGYVIVGAVGLVMAGARGFLERAKS